MRTIQLWLKQIAKLGLLMMMGISMSACAGLFNRTLSWKEEVRLHDGNKLMLERKYNLGGYRAIESSERTELDETVTFSLPNSNKQITWKTDFRDAQPEPNSLNLLLLDIIKGVPYIATYPAGCIAYNKWQRPNPPYILFKYQDNDWKQIPLAEFPAELTKTNVMIGGPQRHDPKSFYTADAVDAENDRIRIPEYKTILREAIPNAGGSRCGKEIPYGDGGWLGIDWFTDQPSLDACLKFCDRKNVSAGNCPCNSIFKGK
jgi:hypothetical protein